jgi:hypothetical protein
VRQTRSNNVEHIKQGTIRRTIVLNKRNNIVEQGIVRGATTLTKEGQRTTRKTTTLIKEEQGVPKGITVSSTLNKE